MDDLNNQLKNSNEHITHITNIQVEESKIYQNTIKNLNQQIQELSVQLKNLNEKNKLLTEEKENSLNEESENLLDEIDNLKLSLANYDDLTLDLKASLRQNEILATKIEELQYRLDSQSNHSNEICNIQITNSQEFKNKVENMLEVKQKLESELIEKKNKINQLNSENEMLKSKCELSANENNFLNEKLKTIPLLQTNILSITNKLDEVNTKNKNLEFELNAKEHIIIKLEQEIEILKLKNNEYLLIIQKNKENLSSINNYENKINLLESTKNEIEKTRKKLENVEELNRSTRSVKRLNSTKSIGNSKNKKKESFNYNSEIKNDSILITSPENTEQNEILESNPLIFKPINNSEFYNEDLCEASNPKFYNKDLKEDSLINFSHKKLILKWLNFDPVTKENLKFNLLYKAKKDGFKAADFKKKCNGIKNTLVIVLTSSCKLIGGFTPLMWEYPKGEGFVYEEDKSKNSFLFSLSLEEKYPLIYPSNAICNSTKLGPVFGGGSDLEIVDECNVNYNSFSDIGHSYLYKRNPEEFYGETNYKINDYEVYEVLL